MLLLFLYLLSHHMFINWSSETGLPSVSPIRGQASSSAQSVPLEDIQRVDDYKVNFWR